MCGRFSLRASPDELAAHFELTEVPVWTPRYNIAPTQTAGVVRVAGDGRRWDAIRWGLIPADAPEPGAGPLLINARSESIRDKPSFRLAFAHQRCLVPADGFYEWKGPARARRPVHFHRADGRLLGFAGIWDRWTGPLGDRLESFTILTADADDLVRPVHSRMPVVLAPGHYDRWLDPATPVNRLVPLLAPAPDHGLVAREVHPVVNGTGYDGPQCLDPPPPPAELDLFG